MRSHYHDHPQDTAQSRLGATKSMVLTAAMNSFLQTYNNPGTDADVRTIFTPLGKYRISVERIDDESQRTSS